MFSIHPFLQIIMVLHIYSKYVVRHGIEGIPLPSVCSTIHPFLQIILVLSLYSVA